MPDPQLDVVYRPLGPAEVRSRVFPTTRRGLDPEAVRRFVEEVATALQASIDRESELARRLDDAERRAAEPELDEDTLTAAVGAETAKVLRAAHDAARDVVARAEARAAEIVAQAGSVLTERRREAEQEATRIRERARSEAGAVTESTTAQCRSMVDEAREARRRILADLAERRRALHVQLEQLRAGKDALAEVVEETAKAVEAVRERLASSEETARAAADSAGYVAGFERDLASLESLVDEAGSLRGAEVVDEVGATDADIDAEPLLSAEAVADSAGSVADGSVADGSVADGSVELGGAKVDAAPDELEPDPVSDEPLSDEPLSDEPLSDEPVSDEPLSDEPAVLEADHDDQEGRAGGGSDTHDVVDDLFARLRAATSVEPTRSDDGVAVEGSMVGSSVDVVKVPGRQGDEEPVEGGLATAARASIDDAADLDVSVMLARRDELLASVVGDLARIVKRELRSEQNELLDSLRSRRGSAGAAPLGVGDELAARLATATTSVLVEAWRAGVSFCADAGDATVEPGSDPAKVASELADEVMTSLRSRLDEALQDGGGDDATAELVGAAYRQWRGDRVDVLVMDHATKAFSLGALACLGEYVAVRWAVDDGDVHCPDCDDNVLAGALRAGELFPTGHAHPPAHSGCRCLLVPSGS